MADSKPQPAASTGKRRQPDVIFSFLYWDAILGAALVAGLWWQDARDFLHRTELLQTTRQACYWAWGLWGAVFTVRQAWLHRAVWGPALGRWVWATLCWVGRRLWRLVTARKRPGIPAAPPPVLTTGLAPRRPDNDATLQPPLDLLGSKSNLSLPPAAPIADEVLKKLRALGADGLELVRAVPGVTLTSVYVHLPDSMKPSTVMDLEKDVTVKLGRGAIRIVAAPEEAGVLLFEVPHLAKQRPGAITLRSVLDSQAWREAVGGIPIAIGLTPDGRPLIGDLAAQPHILVAGTTGGGKSVLLNTILVSLLMRFGPDRLKLVLVDPKRVELTAYKGVPHLLRPTCTDPREALQALRDLEEEMRRRYEAFEAVGVKNISGYNRWAESNSAALMPYIVLVCDEFADLILSNQRDVEAAVQALGMLARAAGIHLVLCTQSPRADVVPGGIKANVLGKLSLAVSNATESRIILDENGAEKLFGKGDLLWKDQNRSPQRAQGAYVAEEQVEALVAWWRKHPHAAASARETVPATPQAGTGAVAAPAANGLGQMAETAAPRPAMETVDPERLARIAVLRQGWATTAAVRDVMGRANAVASALVRQMETEGWLGPQRALGPRIKLARPVVLSMEERRRLLQTLGCTDEPEPLPVVESPGTPAEGDDVTRFGTRLTPAEAEDLMLDAAIRDLTAQHKQVADLEQQVADLATQVDDALVRSDAPAFNRLAGELRTARAQLEQARRDQSKGGAGEDAASA